MTNSHPAPPPPAGPGGQARTDDRIAVVGLGLRFPGGNVTPEGFETFLRKGGSGIGPLPADRWDVGAYAFDGTDRPGTVRTVAGGFLDRIDEFDAPFFNIPPKQARFIDPQQRLLLETAWEALEHANIAPTALRHGNSGVYIGSSPVDFPLGLDALAPEELDGALATGMGAYSLSGRLSYFLGLRGPSLTTDTACASSLTALHLAVNGLRRGECDLALCGGVNALHDPRTFVILSHAQMLAPDGRCKSFDEAADGYARAEGCGVLVLKRLQDAVRDGDTVLAVVRGTAIGQDGESAGLSAPNGLAQQAVMRAALADAGLEPGDIHYVEAHGTGTPLGDPIEMNSINAVFGGSHTADEPLVVGSLKANLGHMEPAAGVGGLVKTILQIRAREFFPHLVDKPSSRIPWEAYPIRLAEGGTAWNVPVRRAAVNGFGVAGAIGVAVLEQAPQEPAAAPAPEPGSASDADVTELFTLSAKSRTALAAQIARHREYVAGLGEIDRDTVRDICFTRARGRAHLRYRFAAPVRDGASLRAALDGAPETPGAEHFEVFRKAALLFPGSGAQYVGMGAGLYDRFPGFRDHVEECDRLLLPLIGRSIKELMFGLAPDADPALAQTVFAHAALFTVEFALARLWISWGVRPAALLGHSVGEIAAAAVAGLMPLPDALGFLIARARLIASIPEPGGMAAVAAPAEQVRPYLEPWSDLAIGAINGPGQCVVSGGTHSLASAVQAMAADGLKATTVPVAAPFHSPLTLQIADGLRQALARVRFHEPEYTLISNLTGAAAVPGEMADPDYWVRHMTQSVDFAAGVAAIDARGRHVFLEVGPGSTLVSLARRCVPESRHRWVPSLRRGEGTDASLVRALADVYTTGADLDWARVYEGRSARRISVPAYAFERRAYWLPTASTASIAGTAGGSAGAFGLLGRRVGEPDPHEGVHEFVARLSTRTPAYLGDHTLHGRALMPSAAYIEMLLCAADAVYGTTAVAIEDIQIPEALFLTEQPTELRTVLIPREDGGFTVEIGVTAPDASTTRSHARAVLRAPAYSRASRPPLPLPLPETETETGTGTGTDGELVLDAEAVYAAYLRSGLDYGPRFRTALSVRLVSEGLAVTEISAQAQNPAEHLPPPLNDAGTHALSVLLNDDNTWASDHIGQVRVFKKPRASRLTAVARLSQGGDDRVRVLDVTLYEGGQPVMEMAGMELKRLGRKFRPPAAAAPRDGVRDGVRDGARSGAAQEPAVPMPAGRGPERVAWASRQIRAHVAGLLRIDVVDDVDPHTTFLELGLDSLVALELRSALEDRLGLSLDTNVVFAHPTPERLAEHLDDLLGRLSG